MRRYWVGLAGLMLAATMATPVVAAGVGTAASNGQPGTDSRIPATPAPAAWTTGVQTSEVDGSMFVPCDCLNHRLPTPDSPLETALAR